MLLLMNQSSHSKIYKILLNGDTLPMRLHQSVPLMFSTLNFKNATLTNHDFKHAIKRTQMEKNHQKFLNYASFVGEMVTLSHNVLSVKLKKPSGEL